MTRPGKGLHDVGILRGGSWRTVSVSFTSESLDNWVPLLEQLSNRGIAVIVRLNWGYSSAGTIPKPHQYGEYVDRCQEWVRALMPFCGHWIIGNETNLDVEWPEGQPISVTDYVTLFNRCRDAIKAIQPSDLVMPAAVSPGVPGWQDYWYGLVNQHYVDCDAYALHCYSHDYSHEAVWHGPAWHTYREMLQAIPPNKRHLPVYITEANGGPWQKYRPGWLQTVMGDLQWWNEKPDSQKIHAITFYAHDERGHGYGMAQHDNVIAEYERLEEGGGVIVRPPVTETIQPDVDMTTWDPRLDERGARVIPAKLAPGQEYLHLVSGQWLDEAESGGRHHIFIEPQDLKCKVWWDGGETAVIKDFAMFNAGTPYNIAPDIGIPADEVHHLGLGSIEQPHHNIHTSYHFRWEKRTAPTTEKPTEEPPVQKVPALTHPIADPTLRRITQRFGENEAAYAKFGLKGHNGVDYGVPMATPIHAVADGKAAEVATDPDGYGLYIKLIHSWGESLYAHLSFQSVRVGETLKAGRMIGLSGNSGNSTGPHLHFAMRVNPYNRGDGWNGYTNPLPYLAEVTLPTGANDADLLARIITAEARGESLEGQLAVAWVAMNRAARPDWWGRNLREVLTKPYQFARPADAPTGPAATIAALALGGHTIDPVNGATHFHSGPAPDWAAKLQFVRVIGNHRFFRE